ncbi:LysR substrate-binding domain-containing protein [Vibrio hangzhouensis]|uniref:LysR family transcriptional regulator, transcriptional activator for dmlA n=1 Tax=Vibrio hangzhouensis TaxID=462991 RepID=A0A1H5V1T9_9VIBR|nr:LysR substrate-binding domain-containing protein [Vibrio hangzhouensis]SEF81140.1 LysR family transcriptional regulator, transcriptional activator for dmlA [Vibrio hangzhouensis]
MVLSNTNRKQFPLPEDLRVFLTIIRKESFVAAAEDLGQSPAYISKRVQILEKTLGTKLFHRSTRKIALTEDGIHAQRWATQIIEDMDNFIDDLSKVSQTARGTLNICCSFGFGRNHISKAISQLAERFPELEIRLEVFDRAVELIQEGFDLEIRVGNDLPQQHICKPLLDNQRILCASPTYLEQFGQPATLEELEEHDCLVIKERNTPFGTWNLSDGVNEMTVKIPARLSSNSGEIALQWALDGRGIVLRSHWDVEKYLKRGELVQVLPQYTQSANVWAIYPTRLSHSAKLRACVESLQIYFQQSGLIHDS